MKLFTGTPPRIEPHEYVDYLPAHEYESVGYLDRLKEIEAKHGIPEQAGRSAVKAVPDMYIVTWTWVVTILDSVTILSKTRPLADCKHVREVVSTEQLTQAPEGFSIKDEVARFYQVPAEAEFEQRNEGIPNTVKFCWTWYELEIE